MSDPDIYEQINFEEYENILQNQENVTCYRLNLKNSPIKKLSSKITVINRINLANCRNLTKLPKNLNCHQLNLRNCTALTALPRGLCVRSLIISGCTSLRELPKDMIVEHMEFVARGCSNLRSLNGIFFNLTKMDLRGCSLLRSIPDETDVTLWIDIGGTQIRYIPDSLRRIHFQWNRIPINEKTAFAPDELTVEDIMQEFNQEVRRAMIMRIGYERFFELANPQIIDEDEDPGGQRQLLGFRFRDEEALVALSVKCPSTGSKYVIRVPPNMTTCHQAAAWIAGFENPDEYAPLQET